MKNATEISEDENGDCFASAKADGLAMTEKTQGVPERGCAPLRRPAKGDKVSGGKGKREE
jgi:hypothetical protein